MVPRYAIVPDRWLLPFTLAYVHVRSIFAYVPLLLTVPPESHRTTLAEVIPGVVYACTEMEPDIVAVRPRVSVAVAL